MNIAFWFWLVFLIPLVILAILTGQALFKNLRLKRRSLTIQAGVMLIFIVLFIILISSLMVGEKSAWPLLKNTNQVLESMSTFVKLGMPVVWALLFVINLRSSKRDDASILMYSWLIINTLPDAVYVLMHREISQGRTETTQALPGLLWITVPVGLAMCAYGFVLAKKHWAIKRWKSIGIAVISLCIAAGVCIDLSIMFIR